MKTVSVSTTINASIQNEINTSLIFRYLCSNENVYRVRIAEDLGISIPAVSRAIERLIEEGFVTESEKIPTAKGKRAAELSVNTGKGILIGIDLIKNPTRIAVSDFRGTILERRNGFPLTDSTDVISELQSEVERTLEAHASGITAANPAGNLRAICIGTPSAITDTSNPRVLVTLYRSLEGLDLAESLGRKYRIPIYVENIVKLSALAEANFGVAREYDSVAFVEVSNGIGLGIIIDDHQLAGANGASGELGFTLVGAENLQYAAHHRGFLEQHASTEGIATQAIEAVRKGEQSALLEMARGVPESITAAMVCQAALREDPVARRIIDKAMQYLSVSIINLVLILDPRVVVIGGDICRLPGLQELFIEPIRRNAERVVPFPLPPLAVSTLGDEAGIVGASYHAIQSLITSHFPYKLTSLPARASSRATSRAKPRSLLASS